MGEDVPKAKLQSRTQRVLAWCARNAKLGSPGLFSPFFVRAFQGWAGAITHLAYRPSMVDHDKIPGDRPSLIVANHSGGGGAEVICLIYLWIKNFKGEGRITGLAHPAAFHIPIMKTLLRNAGAVPSTYEHALQALSEGIPVLVFPGGDHEAFRPIWQAGRVDFNQRQGFLKIARQAKVPIVPLAIQGSHYTLPIFWRSKLLPYLIVIPALLGMKRFALTLSGLIVALAAMLCLGPSLGYGWAALCSWFLLGSPLIMFPCIPWTIRAKFGDPLEPETLFGSEEQQRPLSEAYDKVLGEVQKLLDSGDSQ